MKKIALEEHFLSPDFIEYWHDTAKDFPEEGYKKILARLLDFDDLRLEEMDRAGIDVAVLSLSGPGLQIERDTAVAVRRAREINDFLARQIERHPTRYAGFAHLAMQDPQAAADELERSVKELGLKGAMIDGQTHGAYLDEEQFFPFWERAEALDVPIYLHPADAETMYAGYRDRKVLTRAAWGWTVETATHALRLVFGGTFERFPKARLMLGHMGETLPFQLWRFDSRVGLYKKEGNAPTRSPSEIIRQNFLISTSGQCADEPLLCTIAALGSDTLMFAVDYPYESSEVATRFIETAAIAEDVRAKICHGNAERIFGL